MQPPPQPRSLTLEALPRHHRRTPLCQQQRERSSRAGTPPTSVFSSNLPWLSYCFAFPIDRKTSLSKARRDSKAPRGACGLQGAAPQPLLRLHPRPARLPWLKAPPVSACGPGPRFPACIPYASRSHLPPRSAATASSRGFSKLPKGTGLLPLSSSLDKVSETLQVNFKVISFSHKYPVVYSTRILNPYVKRTILGYFTFLPKTMMCLSNCISLHIF